MEKTAKILIKTDDNHCITAISSSVYQTDTVGWTEITEGHGEEFVHVPNDYFGKSLLDENFCYRYKYIDGEITERSEEERLADIPEPVPPPPTNAELAEAIVELAAAIFGGDV